MAFLERIIKEEGPFDAVLCLYVLGHFRDPWAVIAPLHKGLAKYGVIVVSVPNMRHVNLTLPLVLKGEFELMDCRLRDRTHMHWFTKKRIISLMMAGDRSFQEIKAQKSWNRWHKWNDHLTLGFLAFSRSDIAFSCGTQKGRPPGQNRVLR